VWLFNDTANTEAVWLFNDTANTEAVWLFNDTANTEAVWLDPVWEYQYKQTPWLLVRERTIPTERRPIVDEIYCQLLWIEGCRVVRAADPLRSLISVF
jgi:hypothetical protein